MRKALSILLFVAFLWFAITSFNSYDLSVEAASPLQHGSVTYLVCGFDEASENTDALVLVNYSFEEDEFSLLQIPRDTYFSYDTGTKINALFPKLRKGGVEKYDALKTLTNELARSLGIHIDGFIGLSSDNVISLIDSMNGVNLKLPFDIAIEDTKGNVLLPLKSGDNHLNGEQAVLFLRSRNSYAMADIGRIDAQKFLLSALINKMCNDLGFKDSVRVFTEFLKNSVGDHDYDGILKILIKKRGSLSGVGIKYANIPGSTVVSQDGIWYYSISKNATVELLRSMNFAIVGITDPDLRFYNANKSFSDIYYSKIIKPKIYTDESLFGIEIKEK